MCAACSVAASLEAQLAEAMHNLSCTQQELSKALSDYVSDALYCQALMEPHHMLWLLKCGITNRQPFLAAAIHAVCEACAQHCVRPCITAFFVDAILQAVEVATHCYLHVFPAC
jgi:hypothetical protein